MTDNDHGVASTGAQRSETSVASRLISPGADISARAQVAETCVTSNGTHVRAGVKLGENVRVGANVEFVETSDPESSTSVEDSVSIGENSTIYPAVTIGRRALIGPGSVVTRSVPPDAIVEGNPASIVGYVDTLAESVPFLRAEAPSAATVQETLVRGVTVHHFPLIQDMRGSLVACDFDRQVPFVPKRAFLVFDVPSREVRGEHAHLTCHEFLICIHGTCSVVADDGRHRIEVVLDAPNRGIYLPPMTWRVHYKYSSPETILLVYASDYYDASDYIRNYADFLQAVGAENKS